MRTQVNEQHPEPVLQIVIGKAPIIIKAFARISVEADHGFVSLIPFENMYREASGRRGK